MEHRSPSPGMWPVLGSLARESWPNVLKFVVIVLAAQVPAVAGVVACILLHR